MDAVTASPALDYGVAGATLITLYRVLGIMQHFLLTKAGSVPVSADATGDKVQSMSPLACQVDPQHFQRIVEIDRKVGDIHDYTEVTREKISQGAFTCAWQGRDEVRDLLETMRAMTTAMQGLTNEMKRNGNGAANQR